MSEVIKFDVDTVSHRVFRESGFNDSTTVGLFGSIIFNMAGYPEIAEDLRNALASKAGHWLKSYVTIEPATDGERAGSVRKCPHVRLAIGNDLWIAMPVATPPHIAAEQAWKWWATFDDGGFFEFGPYDTRAEAVAALVKNADDCHEGEIVEAKIGVVSLEPFTALHVLDPLYDANSDLQGGPEQDDIFEDVSDAQRADLADRLNAVVKQWATRHGLSFETTTFSEMRNRETIIIELEKVA